MSHYEMSEADTALVQRCVAGDPDAWQTLFDRFHESLLTQVRGVLRRRHLDPAVADDVMGRFWLALVDHDCGRLRHFDAARGRLTTFLIVIACHEVPPGLHELVGRQPLVPLPDLFGATVAAEPLSVGVILEDFEHRLTPNQRHFLHDELLAPAAERAGANGPRSRKLRERVGHQFRAYLAGA
jgi:hypothetical protein